MLGNHDYGELWTNASSMPLPPQCRGNRTGCSYGPLHQACPARCSLSVLARLRHCWCTVKRCAWCARRQSPCKLLRRRGHGLTLALALAQLDVRLAARDTRWHCERWYSLSLLSGAADVFFIDTSPGVAEYQSASWAGNPGASRGGSLRQGWVGA